MGDSSGRPALIVLAAGMGTRYEGLKQLDGLGPAGETIIDYTLYDAIAIGFSKVVFVIRKEFQKEFKERYVSKIKKNIAVQVVFQSLEDIPDNMNLPEGRVKPWGTGHALLRCRDVIKEPFVIVNADDLYGRGPLRLVHDYIKMHPTGRTRICLAGYSLSRTLSSNGGVSRGVCQVDASLKLISITEALEIREGSEGKITGKMGDTECTFSGRELVSMNLIAMTSDIFPLLEAAFAAFLTTYGDDPHAEFYIPDFINSLVATTGVQVLKTESPWAGVTYRSDKAVLNAYLEKLVSQGEYPNRLWD